jgi:hypothetical protein
MPTFFESEEMTALEAISEAQKLHLVLSFFKLSGY